MGQQGANYIYNTGQNLSQGRTRTGEQLAGAIGSQTSALARLQELQGSNVSSLLGAGGTNLASLLQGGAGQQGQSLQALANLLANIGQGAGAVDMAGIPGVTQTQGALGQIGEAAAGIGTAMAASDIRLKENVMPVGVHNGHNFYTWNWNEEGRKIADGQQEFGVIAQEAMEKDPDAVEMINGYLHVNYSRIL